MRLTIEGRTLTGDVLDLRERRVDPDALAAAMAGEPARYDVECPTPGPVHERVGVVREGTTISYRTATALAARSRGLSPPQDDRIRRLREEVAAVEMPTVATPSNGPPADEVTRLRERVAELRGVVRVHEEDGRDPGDARDRLRDVAGRLAELETERAARTQANARLREVRDARERRMRLEDKLANAERAARAHLAEQLRPAVSDALGDLGVAVDDPRNAPADALALAVLRVACVRAPVILAVDRFTSPRAAANWLDAPVIRL